ncbi:g5659 [Coccomyxa viridis]|uniref:Inositol-pentakisphosphate 2-kinase n=1 Tax=Coccomyxa viridis TaxID=1274662 RepID=A0ABP1FXB6_9CHLO
MYDFEPEEASCWRLKGQGNANAVFAYASGKEHHVLRVRKEKLPENTHPETSEALAGLEKKVWEGVITDWGSGGAAQDQYENKVLRPLLGAECFHRGEYVRLPVDFAATLARTYGLQLSQDAWIAPDHTVFCPQPSQEPGPRSRTLSCAMPTICLELKPKCGFLPTSPCIHPGHSIKRRVPRFQLHQQLKLAQGKAENRSSYNPLDLFSGDSLKMHEALNDLLTCPQNNLRLFVDGEPIAQHRLEQKLVEVSSPHGGLDWVLSTITAILLQTGVLIKVLGVQKLDTYDVEGIKVLVDSLLAEASKASAGSSAQPSGPGKADSCTDTTKPPQSTSEAPLHEAQREALKPLLQLDSAAAFQAVRDYLTAVTAKDLSIMITFRRSSRHTGSDDSAVRHTAQMEVRDPEAHVLTDGGHETEYMVALVDLDIKPLKKIYEHWKLDRDIMWMVADDPVASEVL